MDWSNIIIAIIGALGFAISGYWKNWAASPPPKPPFDYYKFLATIAVGAGIGIFGALMGVTITEQYVGAQLMVYAAAVTLIENLLKGLLGTRWPSSTP